MRKQRYEYEVHVTQWHCTVTNMHVGEYGGRPIRQQTIIQVDGIVIVPQKRDMTVTIYLTFDDSAHGYDPSVDIRSPTSPRIDIHLNHGQEAAAIKILESGKKIKVVFAEPMVRDAQSSARRCEDRRRAGDACGDTIVVVAD